MSTPELRKLALDRMETFLDRLPDSALKGLAHGDQVLALLTVDGRLAFHARNGIESAYDYLSKLNATDIKAHLSLPAPTGKTKPLWLDHVLLTLFGITYTPPAPPKPAAKPRAAKTVKRAWNAAEAARLLSLMDSQEDGERLLSEYGSSGATIKQMTELADLLQIPVKGRKAQVIHDLLWGAIGGPGRIKRAASD